MTTAFAFMLGALVCAALVVVGWIVADIGMTFWDGDL